MDTRELIEKAKKDSIAQSIKDGVKELEKEEEKDASLPAKNRHIGSMDNAGHSLHDSNLANQLVTNLNTISTGSPTYTYTSTNHTYVLHSSGGEAVTFSWDPKPDITTYELAKAMHILMGRESLTDELLEVESFTRHFKQITE